MRSTAGGKKWAYELTPRYESTLVQRKQVVVPIAVCVGSKVSGSSRRTNDADVRPLTRAGIKYEKCIRPRFDAGDHLLASPFPPRLRIPQMRDVLVGTVRVGLRDARYSYVCHLDFPFGAFAP